jgi:hypothetical protein
MDEFTENIMKAWGFKDKLTIFKGNVEQIIIINIINKRFVICGT